MDSEFCISIVYDNKTADSRQFHAAWGFSCFIEGFGEPLLFDSGASGPILMHNLVAMGLHPGALARCVISHCDWDHLGGIWDVLRNCPGIELFVPESMSATFQQELGNQGATVFPIGSDSCELVPGIRLTGQMSGDRDEIGLVLELPGGSILLTGCAHPGIVAMSSRCIEMTGSPPRLVMGGLHLSKESPARITSILDELCELGVERFAPAHCTGERACELFKERFGENVFDVAVGKRFKENSLF